MPARLSTSVGTTTSSKKQDTYYPERTRGRSINRQTKARQEEAEERTGREEPLTTERAGREKGWGSSNRKP